MPTEYYSKLKIINYKDMKIVNTLTEINFAYAWFRFVRTSDFPRAL